MRHELRSEETARADSRKRPSRPGFFVLPADEKANAERVFVIASATREVTLL